MIFKFRFFIILFLFCESLQGQHSNFTTFFDLLKNESTAKDTIMLRDSSIVYVHDLFLDDEHCTLKEVKYKSGGINSIYILDSNGFYLGPMLSFFKDGKLSYFGFNEDSLAVGLNLYENNRIKEFSFSIFAGAIDYKLVNCLSGEKYDEWVYNDDNTKCLYKGYYCEGGIKKTGSYIIKDKVYYDKIKDGFWIYYSEDGLAVYMEEYFEGELLNRVDFIDDPR